MKMFTSLRCLLLAAALLVLAAVLASCANTEEEVAPQPTAAVPARNQRWRYDEHA